MLEDISALSEFSQLESLNLNYSGYEADLNPIGQVKSLKRLYLEGLDFDLQIISNLENLELLVIDRCRNLENLQVIERLPNLQKLVIRKCASTPHQLDVSSLSNLAFVHVRESNLSIDFSTLTDTNNLQSVILYDCPYQRTLVGIEKALKLNHFTIGVTRVSSLDPLAGMSSLKSLCVQCDSFYKSIEDLDPLRSLTGLEKLVVSHRETGFDFSLCEAMTQLKQLRLYRHGGSINKAALSNLPAMPMIVDQPDYGYAIATEAYYHSDKW